jgi:hypothetical protein
MWKCKYVGCMYSAYVLNVGRYVCTSMWGRKYVCGDVCMCVGMYVCAWGFMCVYGVVCICVRVYIYRHKWAKGNRERERKSLAQKYECEKTRSANAKARNLRPNKLRESASAKGFRQEPESDSAKTPKKRVPSSVNNMIDIYLPMK